MATTTSTCHQYFSGSGAGTITFARSVTSIIITVSGSVNMSLDGTNFMPLTNGTYQFSYVWVKDISFTGGTWSGFGISV